ncbi:hypothetical protein CsSME_00022384 [Camellia sinensis var. sinensis]
MNKEVFENHTKLPHISAKLILTQARETQDAFKAILNPHYKDPQLMFWSCPIAGKLKLNTDGSSKGDPGQAGYGGLLRDEAGTWVWGFYGYLGSCTSLEAELWSIYRDGAAANSPYRVLIEDANFRLRRCQCSIEAIPRETNNSADAMANLGVNQQEHLIVLEDPPSSISVLSIADMMNVGSRRA